MKFVTVTELRAHAPRIISEIETTKEEITVTKNGKPVVLMRFVEEREYEIKTRKKEGK